MELITNAYLPHAITDAWHTAKDIVDWLEANGEPVRAISTTATFSRALTWSGKHVYLNGWVAPFG